VVKGVTSERSCLWILEERVVRHDEASSSQLWLVARNVHPTSKRVRSDQKSEVKEPVT